MASKRFLERGGVVVVLYLLLGGLYSWLMPLGEGADEIHHLRYIRFMQEQKRIPEPLVRYEGYPQIVMGHHPPFYYGLMALLCGWCDFSDAEETLVYNPHFVWAENEGVNGFAVHVAEAVPVDSGTVRGIRYMRLWSVVWGALAVVAVGWVTREIWPERVALGMTAMALVAFQPSFLAISSTLHNDVLVTGLMGVALAQMVIAVRGDWGWRAWLGAGLVTGLALITKLSALSLVPVWVLVVVYRWWKRGKRHEVWGPANRQFVSESLWLGGTVIVVAGWWYGRNWLLYGSPLPVGTVIAELFPHVYRQVPLTWGLFRLEVLGQLWRGFWGAFGYMQVTVPREVSWGLWLLMGPAVLAWVVGVIRFGRELVVGKGKDGGWDRVMQGIVLIGLMGLTGLAVGRLALTMTGAGQARYVLPLWVAAAPAVAWGWHWWVGWRWRWVLTGVVVLGGWVLGVWVLDYVVDLYAPIGTVARVPEAVGIEGIDFGGEIALVGYGLGPRGLGPGEEGVMRFYWQAGEEGRGDLWIEATLYDRFGAEVWGEGFWPDRNGTTAVWGRERVYVSERPLTIPAYIARGEGQLVMQVRAGGADGALVGREQVVGSVLIGAEGSVGALPAVAEGRREQLGENIYLRGVVGPVWEGEKMILTLYWEATAEIEANYTVF
ncbi:MAG TPA: hypothetical protein VLL52_14995, partial [Anaerolineae bacterium]|nr:hypothetical protein [Anaerolineae bacterium]